MAINHQTLHQYLAYLKKEGASPATLKRKEAALKKFQSWQGKEYGSRYPLPKGAPKPKKIISKGISPKIFPPFLRYFSFLIGLVLLASLGWGVYSQFFAQPKETPSMALPTNPPFLISFQGQLTDEVSTPINATVSATFRLYNVDEGGTALWEEQKNITSDTDGIFNTFLGDTTTLDPAIFRDNMNLWLAIEIDNDGEMEPRQQIATVGYAFNSRYLQGYEATTTATANTIPVINADGDLILASSSPAIEATSGTFGLKGEAIIIQSTGGTGGGDILIQPDADTQGQVIIYSATTADNSFTVQNSNITTGSLIYGEAGTSASGYNLLKLASGSPLTDKFVVDYAGNTDIAGNLTVDSSGFFASNVGVGTTSPSAPLSVGSSSQFQVDSSGDIVKLKNLTYSWPTAHTANGFLKNNGSGGLSWSTDITATSLKWNALTNPDGNLSLSHQAYTTTFTWGDSTGTNNLFTLTDTANNTGTGYLLNLNTATGSSLKPLRVTAGGTEALAIGANGNIGIGTINPGTYKLNVAGNTYLGGTLTTSGTISAGSTLYLANGTASSPALTFTNDTNSGLYRLAEDKIGLVTGGTATKGITIDSAGNVGIGTTSPQQKLDIVGKIYFNDTASGFVPTLATTQFVAGGDLSFISNWASLGYNAIWDGSQSRWEYMQSNSAFVTYHNRDIDAYSISAVEDGTAGNTFTLNPVFNIKSTGNVGIGTTAPGSYKLNVAGNSYIGGTLTTTGAISAPTSSNTINGLVINGSGVVTTGTWNASLIPLAYGGTNKNMTAVSGGIVWTDADSQEVSSAGSAGQFLVSGGTGAPTWTSDITANSLKWNALENPDGNLSLSMEAYTTTFTWGASTGANNLFTLADTANNTGTGYLLNLATASGSSLKPLRVAAGVTEALVVNASGNVGIGTTEPGGKLDVAGKIWQTGTGRSVFLGEGAGTSDDLSNNYGVFIGYQAGYNNTTGSNNSAIGYQSLYSNNSGYENSALGLQSLYSNTTGYGNAAVGAYALYSNNNGFKNSAMGTYALYSNYSGSNNSTIGYQSLRQNTTGSNNSAIGYQSLYSNTTGYENSTIGLQSLYSNTTGSNNSTMGSYSLYSNTTGNNNSAIGYSAGRYITDGSTGNTTSDYSVYLGANTKAKADDDQNEIVIGYNTTGFGSNTAAYGNSSMTGHIFQAGNVGIGTTSPQQKLTLGSGSNFVTEMTTPGAPTLTCNTSGGTLADGTYSYKIVASDGAGYTTGGTSSSCTITGGSGAGSVSISWAAITGASSYRVYGRDTGYGQYWTSSTPSYTDTGTAGTTGTPPAVTTAYVNKFTASGNSWLLGGNVGIGTTVTTTPSDYDLLIGEYGGTSLGYENTGSASSPAWTARSAWNAPDVGASAVPAFADLDNDGDYDLLIGKNDGTSLGYENTGSASSPTWAAKSAWNAPDVGDYSAVPAFADLDNDGDYDLLIGGSVGISFGYENTGSASSPAWTAKSAWNAPDVGNYAAPALADLDNDGDYDLLIGESGGTSLGYENTGSASSPAWTAKSAWNAPDVGTFAAPAFADLDNDTGAYKLKVAGIVRASGGFSTGDEIFMGNLDETTDYIKGTINLDLIGTEGHNLTIRDWDNVIISGGNVGIGTTGPTYRLQLPNNADNSGKGQANAWVTYSDISLKENIEPIENALDKILNLRGVTFDWKGQGVPSSGFIAQEVEPIIPNLVTTDSNGLKSLDYGRFTPYLVEAFKEQQSQISFISSQLESLSLTSTGELQITRANTNENVNQGEDETETQNAKLKIQNENSKFKIIKSQTGETIERIITGADGVFARIKTGAIETTNLIADSLIAKNISVEKKIISPIIETEQLNLKTQNAKVKTTSQNSKVTIVNSQDEPTAEFDTETKETTLFGDLEVAGNVGIGQEVSAPKASFGDLLTKQINTDTAQISADATISGTLYVDRVVAREGGFGELLAENLSVESIKSIVKEEVGILNQVQDDSLGVSQDDGGESQNLDSEEPSQEEFDLQALLAKVEEWAGTSAQNDLSLECTNKAEGQTLNQVQDDGGETIQNDETSHSELDPESKNLCLVDTNFTVLGGRTSLADTAIAGQLSVGSLVINNNSLDVLGDTLYLQKLAMGGLDILNGKLTVDINGNVFIAAHLTVGGGLATNEIRPMEGGDLTFNLDNAGLNEMEDKVSTQEETGLENAGFGKLLVKGINNETVASIDASGSAEFKKVSTDLLEINTAKEASQSGEVIIAAAENFENIGILAPGLQTNATAGEATLPAGEKEIIIYNDKLTDQSLVYLTPTADTENKILYVKEKVGNTNQEHELNERDTKLTNGGYFVVGLNEALNWPVKFNWWIIN